MFGGKKTILATPFGTLLKLASSTHHHPQHCDVDACCALLRDVGTAPVYFPNDTVYQNRTDSYWSVTAQLMPSCYVLPENTQEVSDTIKIIGEQTGCNFAVRSGGHSSVPGANNIDEGVTIDLGHLNGTTYDQGTEIAQILPGTRWHDVYTVLDEYDAGVPGGQLGAVGVGGLLTGGGASHYINQVGFACDSIVNAEIVLASGEIINANATSHHELWQSIKGGGRIFGIITRFDMQTFHVPPIWGGDQAHKDTEATTEAYIKALASWVDNLESYPEGYACALWSRRLVEKEDQIIATIAETSAKVEAPAFDVFRRIPDKTVDNMSMTNMSAMSLAVQADGLYNFWWTVTVKNTEEMIRANVDAHRRLVQEIERECSGCDFETQAFWQPLPSVVARHGVERGGNALGLEGRENNALILLASVAVRDEEFYEMAREKILNWKKFAEDHGRLVGGLLPYLYMNYADGSQDVLASYGDASVAKLRKVAAKYDPEGVFHTREPGGFKLPDH